MSDTSVPVPKKPNLGQKFGGIPLYVWAIGAGLVIGLYLYKKRTAAANAVATDSAGSPIATGAGGSVDQTGGVGSGAGGWLYQTPTTANQAAAITTNDEWYSAAMSDLLAKNYDPNLADSSLRTYLAAQPLLPNQLAVVAIAIRDIGALPEPLPPSGQTIPNTGVVGGVSGGQTQTTRPVGVTGVTGGFTGGVGDHVSGGTRWGAPLTGTHAGTGWGT